MTMLLMEWRPFLVSAAAVLRRRANRRDEVAVTSTEPATRGTLALVEALRPDMFHPQCPSRAMPIKVGDKWAALIIRCLEGGPRRFGELRVPLSRVTPKVLTESLRALERDGFVARTAHPGHPPRVEYELTPLGRTLLRPLADACAWADEHGDRLHAARADYGRRTSRDPKTA
jgi:DNA-binding HxlR family transcriptional regulator